MNKPDFLTSAMKQAAAEGRRWMGATSPNPPVGALALDTDGRVLAIAAHHRAGEPHAEASLITDCRNKNILNEVETLCVTLEPCNHYGRTPPCVDAIIQARIKKVVIGTRDPNPDVKGGGIERLRTAGIEIITGIAETECQQLMHAFAYRATTGKPWITIKRAIDKDGSMIPPAGQKTFTSPDSIRLAHRLRKKSDAILTGSGTILADFPLFTVRSVPDHKGKRRKLAIIDRRARVPESYINAATERGFDVLIYQDFIDALNDLAKKGAQDVLIEAGPQLSQSLLDSGVWTMSVTIRQEEMDNIDVAFNPHQSLPFDAQQFCWEHFLPQE